MARDWLVLGGTVADGEDGSEKLCRSYVQSGRDAVVAGRDATVIYVFNGTPQPVARSAYLEQVRLMAPRDPPGLQERDSELAELAQFCLAPDAASYVWWRAGPWAGKSALLSSFVLRPPRELAGKVSIVSFFVTAGYAAQETRSAFTEVLIEQLAALLGQPLPTALSEATREAYLLDQMSRAAAACKGAGGRLVLVVDGLDEDRGVTTGPTARSIAGLLPPDPPDGMRVIVAGRADPPVPDDVPGRHPLRDPAIVRPLAPSPHAQDVGRLATRELRDWLRGTPAQRDILGLLTAARGGLTARDLADLCGIPRWEAEDVLHAVAGRTLQSRLSRLGASRPEVYLLGHEELQATAVSYLGDSITGYHERLHNWASDYRARGWPADTPEYLLTGYFLLLEDLGDLPRMIEFGRDSARHDRMLGLTGGDVAGAAEVRAALDGIATDDDPDLAGALALAYHRDRLADRNVSIPASLPAVWAMVGQPSRAEAAASSLGSPYRRARALAELAEALAEAGQGDRALEIGERAEEAACLIADLDERAVTLAAVSASLASPLLRDLSLAVAGRAEALARQAMRPASRASAFAAVTHTLARAGRLKQALAAAEHAEVAAGAVPVGPGRHQSLQLAAGALARAGQCERAVAVAMSMASQAGDSVSEPLAVVADGLARIGQFEQAESVARSIPGQDWQAVALARLAGALAIDGRRDQAADLAVQAETAAGSISYPRRKVQALGAAAWALAQAGRYEEAVAAATRAVEAAQPPVKEPAWRAEALGQAAGVLAQAGRREQAEVILRQAEADARGLIDPSSRAETFVAIAVALAEAGQHMLAEGMAQQAEEIARSATRQDQQALSVAGIARTLGLAGHDEQALAIAELAEAAALEVPIADHKAMALAQIAKELACAGQDDRVLALAEKVRVIATPLGPESRAEVLLDVARALAQAEQPERAADVASEAITAARTITHTLWQAHVLASAAVELARAGQPAKACDVAAEGARMARPSPLVYTSQHTTALTQCGVSLAHLGRHEDAVRAVSLIPSLGDQSQGLAKVAGALVRIGHHEQAMTIAGTIQDMPWRANALLDIAEVLAGTEQRMPALDAASKAEAAIRSTPDPDPTRQPLGLARVARALARAGHQEQAVDAAGRAEAAIGLIIDPSGQDESLACLAEALVLAKQHVSAAGVAARITGPAWQGYALVIMAENLAQAGNFERAADTAREAEAAVRQISDAQLQGQALERLTSALIQAKDAATARKMAARACAIGQWATAAKAVLQVSPEASRELAITLANG
jgi:tetratricopeptide (TPR) repeat protein